MINEVLADPAPGQDPSCDGDLSLADDEFVELVNAGARTVDLADAVLADRFGERHRFAAGTRLHPGEVIVVFGGGSPVFDGTGEGDWCGPLPPNVEVLVASSGSLGLTNFEEDLELRDRTGAVVTTASWGTEGDADQSLVRVPELSDQALVHHTAAPYAVGPWSPGRRVDGSAFEAVVFTETADTARAATDTSERDTAASDTATTDTASATDTAAATDTALATPSDTSK